MERTRDYPEVIAEAWTQFEREEGTLEDLEAAEAKIKKRMERAQADRAKEAVKEEELQQKRHDKIEKKKEKDKDKRREKRHALVEQKKDSRKRKVDQDSGPDSKKIKSGGDDEAFKVPPPPGFVKPTAANEVAPPPGFTPIVDNDKERQVRTVFVSNLDYKVDEDTLNKVLGSSGAIKEVRLVKNPKGTSRGFAYVEFENKASVAKALARDHEPIDGRPMFVSECDPEKKGHHFKYGTDLEKNKIFVKNIPKNKSKDEVEAIFAVYGAIKDIRVVTYKDGKSKGIAYVEFADEKSASTAVMKADGMSVDGRELAVALSNPPKKNKPPPSDMASLGGGARANPQTMSRPRAHIAFVPRSLMKKEPAKAAEATNGDGTAKAKSNQEFRNMFLSKKN